MRPIVGVIHYGFKRCVDHVHAGQCWKVADVVPILSCLLSAATAAGVLRALMAPYGL